MNKEQFWKIIDLSLQDNTEGLYQDEALKQYLETLSPEYIGQFFQIFDEFHELANRGDIWAAGMLANGGHGSDDGFLYFRNWLISCGKAVYFSVLKNPDCLADLELYLDENGHPDAEFESFGYAAVDAYKSRTNGRNIYDDFPDNLEKDLKNWNWQDYDNEQWLTANLPRMWSKYGKIKIEFERSIKNR